MSRSCERVLILSIGCLLLEALFSYAVAGSLSVTPMHVLLSPVGGSTEVHVTNVADEESFVQVSAFPWTGSAGAGQPKPTSEILAVPPVFDLKPNSTQLVRLAIRNPLEGDREQAYRLIITEIPKTAGLVPNSVSVAVRMTLPVFVTPEGTAPAPVWALRQRPLGEPDLVLVNEGTARVNIKKVTLLDGQAGGPAFETKDGGFVLAGEEKIWPLDVDLARLKGPLILKAETDIGPIEASVSLP